MTVMLLLGDCRATLKTMRDKSVHCCVTSPPYFGLRDYQVKEQIGLEPTPDEFVAAMVEVFREVKRVLRDDGTLWLNLGDSYGSSGGDIFTGFNARYHGSVSQGDKQSAIAENAKSAGNSRKYSGSLRPKNLLGIPWRVAFALQADGWYLRQDIIWHKPNPMPESVRDRCTKSHEYIFMLSKSPRYYFDSEAIREEAKPESAKRYAAGYKNFAKGQFYGSPVDKRAPKEKTADQLSGLNGRNRRSVWTVSTKPFKGAHFATFPPDLIEPCVLAGAPVGGVVLDPFGGAGTTGLVAQRNGRNSVLCELNYEYVGIACERLGDVFGWLPECME